MLRNKAFWWIALFINIGIAAYWHTCRLEERCNTALTDRASAVAIPGVPGSPVRLVSLVRGWAALNSWLFVTR